LQLTHVGRGGLGDLHEALECRDDERLASLFILVVQKELQIVSDVSSKVISNLKIVTQSIVYLKIVTQSL
jgi:hypothetical protein